VDIVRAFDEFFSSCENDVDHDYRVPFISPD